MSSMEGERRKYAWREKRKKFALRNNINLDISIATERNWPIIYNSFAINIGTFSDSSAKCTAEINLYLIRKSNIILSPFISLNLLA